MAVLTRVYRAPTLGESPTGRPDLAATNLADLVHAGALDLPAGDVLGAVHAAMAYASRAGAAERITLLADGSVIRLLVSGSRERVKSLKNDSPRLPGTLADRLLASILDNYDIPYHVLHVDYLPENRTLVCALRLEHAA